MQEICAHLKSSDNAAARGKGCEECLKIGERDVQVLGNVQGGNELPLVPETFRGACQEAGVSLRIAVVEGDDLLPRRATLADLRPFDEGGPLPAALTSTLRSASRAKRSPTCSMPPALLCLY